VEVSGQVVSAARATPPFASERLTHS
jgi:hypothetical protein